MNEKDSRTTAALLASGLMEPIGVRIGAEFCRKSLVVIKRFRNNDPDFPEETQESQVEKILATLISKYLPRCKGDEHQRRRDILAALGARAAIVHVLEQTSPPEKCQRLPGWGRWK